jgi:hypothetical protein
MRSVMSIEGAAATKPAKNEYLDPKGYWIDPERTIRRMDGDQVVIIKATADCSDAEWKRFYVADCILASTSGLRFPSKCEALRWVCLARVISCESRRAAVYTHMTAHSQGEAH